METTLELVSTKKPYIFESLGVLDYEGGKYNQSILFPQGTQVELTSGKFPLNDYTNKFNISNMTHVIGGKTVRIIGFSYDCEESKLKGKLNKNGDKNGGCLIRVVDQEYQDGGRRKRRSRSRRRRSTRRKQ